MDVLIGKKTQELGNPIDKPKILRRVQEVVQYYEDDMAERYLVKYADCKAACQARRSLIFLVTIFRANVVPPETQTAFKIYLQQVSTIGGLYLLTQIFNHVMQDFLQRRRTFHRALLPPTKKAEPRSNILTALRHKTPKKYDYWALQPVEVVSVGKNIIGIQINKLESVFEEGRELASVKLQRLANQ